MIRYKTYASGRKMRLCIGNNNTCPKEQRKNGLCAGCTTGFDKTFFFNRREGEIFEKDGIRYKFIGGQSRHLCKGDNNTCQQYRADGLGLCVGHKNNSLRTRNDGLKNGDIVVLNGRRYRFNGIQKTRVCNEVLANSLCNQGVVKSGKCKTHSPDYRCQYSAQYCPHRKVSKSNYCNRHENNVENPHRFIGEHTTRTILQRLNIKYSEQPTFLGCAAKNLLRFDFWIQNLNLLIEFDGEQHFMAVKHWGGVEGLQKRILYDSIKDEWCLTNDKFLLRISYRDINHIEDIIKSALDTIKTFIAEEPDPANPRGLIMGTAFYSTICTTTNPEGIRDTSHYFIL